MAEESNWKGLLKLGGIGALIAGPLTIIDIMVYAVWPQPSSVTAWFSLFHKSWIVGLLDLDFLGMIIYIVVIPTILAFYVTLRRTSQSWSAVGGVLAFIGMVTYFASNTGVSMLSLSGQYAAATNDTQRTVIQSAGQAVLAIFFGPAFTTSFFLVSAALLITAVVMLRSPTFSARIAYVGIIANAAGVLEQLPVPTLITLVIVLVNAIGLGIWFISAGRRLWQLGQDATKIAAGHK